MTQYQQVLAAIKKIGGKGTTDEIYNAIDDINSWKTKTKKASVASYLSTGIEFKKENDTWIYDETLKLQDSDNRKVKGSGKIGCNIIERGLYFITLNPIIKPPFAGLLFKVGLSDGDANNRLKAYGRSLPYNPILELGFFRVPDDVNLEEVEKQVRGELLGNDTLGFKIERFFSSGQLEWLQTLDLSLNEENITKLATVVNNIIKDTIDNLRKVI